MSSKGQSKDLINRGDKTPTPLGTATFVGLRAADVPLQYAILSGAIGGGLISRLGSSVLSPQGILSNTGTILDNLNLSPYRLALLGMSAGAFLKHAFWRLALAGEPMPPGPAALVGAFNAVFNSANSLLFICTATSAAKYIGEGPQSRKFPGAPLAVGSTLFISGIVIETLSEIQRTAFKRKEENQGKPSTGGLWAVSRHVNYFGYTLWRGGYALAAGGWIWGSAVAAWFAFDFVARAIPVLEEYCENRYADMWHIYEEKTPYKFVPYIY